MKIKNYINYLSILISIVWISDLSAQDGWERMADMPQATSWYGSCIDPVGEKAYIFGGGFGEPIILLNTTQIYDFETDTWSLGASMLQASSAFSADMVNGKIYIIGEHLNPHTLTTVKEYDPLNDTWSEKGLLPEIFIAQGSCVYDGLIYLFGGRKVDPSPINTVRSYDPETDTWTELADMPYSRFKSAVCIYEDEIYLFGGNPSMKYTPSTDSWNEINADSCKIDGYQVPIIDGDRILLFGGYKYGGNYPNPCNEIWAYYPIVDTLMKLDNEMPFNRFTRGHKYNNYVYLFGGHYNNTLGSVTDEVWRINLDSISSSINENKNDFRKNLILNQIYPNPFSNSITIGYELIQPDKLTISIYNHLGQQVEEITKGKSFGQQKIKWDCIGLPAGIYFCVLKSNNEMQIQKIIKL